MVRGTVEARGGAAFRIGAGGEIACVESGGDARDVGLERQHLQIELQLDVFVERRGHAVGSLHGRDGGGGFAGDFQAALDLGNVFEIFVDAVAVSGADVLFESAGVL